MEDIAPSIDLLRPLLPPSNPYLRSLKVDCTRLDDSSLGFLLRPSLQDLSLRNCGDFSGKLLSELGRSCKELRFVVFDHLFPRQFTSFFAIIVVLLCLFVGN